MPHFFDMLEIAGYYYKRSFHLKLLDVARRIVDLLVAITDAD
jgi:hypothetical protein